MIHVLGIGRYKIEEERRSNKCGGFYQGEGTFFSAD